MPFVNGRCVKHGNKAMTAFTKGSAKNYNFVTKSTGTHRGKGVLPILPILPIPLGGKARPRANCRCYTYGLQWSSA
jgi:hypothetical protein